MASAVQIKSGDRRADERLQVSRRAVLRTDGKAIDIEIEDMTRSGCRIRTDAELKPYGEVSIGLPGIGHTPARLVWRSADGYGCAFDRLLPAGAITRSAMNNVTTLAGAPLNVEDAAMLPVKYSRRTRAGIIFGSAAALWAVILAGGALLI